MIVPREETRIHRLPGRVSRDPFPDVSETELTMRIVRVESKRRTPHLHPKSQEAIYVVEGRGLLWSSGITRPIRAGDSILIDRGVPHATISDPGTELELVCFWPHPDLDANTEEFEDVIIGPTDEEQIQ